MKLFKIFSILISIILFVSPAIAGGINGKTMQAIANGDLAQAKSIFSGHTIVMKRPNDNSGYRLEVKGVPVAGTFVAYLSSNGRILIWSKDAKKVISGVWAVVMSKGQKPKMLFCMNLSKQKQKVPCMVVKYMGNVVFDSAKGNIFNLKSGGSVPASLPYSRSLSTIQKKIK